VAHVPIILAGTQALYDLFTTSSLTHDVRAQLSSRVAFHYPLAGLTVEEAKAIITRSLGDHATDKVVTQIYNITGGIHRHLDMIIPRIKELIELNAEDLKAGRVSMEKLIDIAGSRLMVS
jgi:hypothetical protein